MAGHITALFDYIKSEDFTWSRTVYGYAIVFIQVLVIYLSFYLYYKTNMLFYEYLLAAHSIWYKCVIVPVYISTVFQFPPDEYNKHHFSLQRLTSYKKPRSPPNCRKWSYLEDIHITQKSRNQSGMF